MSIPVYFTQRDNTQGQSHRTCFTSCCAMVIATYRRDQGKTEYAENPNWDDEYKNRVFVYGDTTSWMAQKEALKFYGFESDFWQNKNFQDMQQWLKEGLLAPCGMLHHGPVNNPSGGGHYVLPYAIDANNLTVHDPYLEQDLVNGGFTNLPGKSVTYSRKNFGPRWMVGGGNTGWALIIKRPR